MIRSSSRNRAARCFTAFAAALAPAAAAQTGWSSDAAQNLDIADRTGDQVQPKIRATADGGAYVSWFDNSVCCYRPTIQRLTARGAEVFVHNGITLANTTNTSTVDYDLAVDGSDNALVTFMDNSGGTSQVTVQKVSPTGALLWGAGGVQMAGSAGAGNPHVAALSDGSVMVGWTVSPGFTLQRLSAAGAPVGAPILVSEAGRSITLSDLRPSNAGSVIALWVRPFTTSFQSNKFLVTQKYDAAGATVWPSTTLVYPDPPTPPACNVGPQSVPGVVIYAPNGGVYGCTGGSVQNGYFPTFAADGAGGAVYAWYENAGPRNVYVQRVDASGAIVFNGNGTSDNGSTNALPVSTLSRVDGDGRSVVTIALTPSLAYSASTDEIMVAWSEANASTQSTYWAFVQKFSGSGVAQWAAGGVPLLEASTNQSSFVRALPSVDGSGAGVMAFLFDARSATTHVIQGWRVGAAGTQAWSPVPLPVSSAISGKSRLDAALSASGTAMLAWGDNRAGGGGGSDIFVQNVRPASPGALGNPPCRPDVTGDGAVNVSDFLAYLQLYAAGADGADMNDDQQVNVSDFLAFLGLYAAGC
jgi:hypothetical protein